MFLLVFEFIFYSVEAGEIEDVDFQILLKNCWYKLPSYSLCKILAASKLKFWLEASGTVWKNKRTRGIDILRHWACGSKHVCSAKPTTQNNRAGDKAGNCILHSMQFDQIPIALDWNKFMIRVSPDISGIQIWMFEN